MKFGQIIMHFMTNTSYLFLTLFWRFDTSSIPIYDSYKTSLKQHLVVFKIMFTIFDCLDAYFQKIKKPQTHHAGFWLIVVK